MEHLGLAILLTFVLFIVLLFVVEYNKFTKLRNKVKQSKSTIDVYLNKRFDLIPNLVECVKAYSKYEESLFEKITKMRADYTNNKKLEDGSKANVELDKIVAVIEKYPELKASEQFLDLQKNLASLEDELQAARRLYNGDVTLYNTTLETFPNSLFAKLYSFKKDELFELEEFKRENIKLNM